MGVALKCTNCATASVSSLFYLGPDAHVCKACGAPFELEDPAHDRRVVDDRRTGSGDDLELTEWRSGLERRTATAG